MVESDSCVATRENSLRPDAKVFLLYILKSESAAVGREAQWRLLCSVRQQRDFLCSLAFLCVTYLSGREFHDAG